MKGHIFTLVAALTLCQFIWEMEKPEFLDLLFKKKSHFLGMLVHPRMKNDSEGIIVTILEFFQIQKY